MYLAPIVGRMGLRLPFSMAIPSLLACGRGSAAIAGRMWLLTNLLGRYIKVPCMCRAGLALNRTLEKLHLKGNRVGRLGASALATLIRNTSTLKFIDLTNNDIGTEGVKMLASALNDRYRNRANAKQTARRAGVFTGDGALKVRGNALSSVWCVSFAVTVSGVGVFGRNGECSAAVRLAA